MRNRGSVSRSAIVVLCVAALGMLGMDGQDSGPLVTPAKPANVLPGVEPVSDPASPTQYGGDEWTGWKCKKVTECPKAYLIGWDRNYIGCYRILGLGCGGECKECSGNPHVQYDACVEEPNQVCGPQGGGSHTNQIPCGKIVYKECEYSSSAAAGSHTTPNSCYCTGESRVSLDNCYVAECGRNP